MTVGIVLVKIRMFPSEVPPELSKDLDLVLLVDSLTLRDPVNVDHVVTVKIRDHHCLLDRPAMPDLLWPGETLVLSL